MTKTTAQPRLSEPAAPGANLYNAFHLVTQLGALYGVASQMASAGFVRTACDELSTQVVDELGAMHQLWSRLVAARESVSASDPAIYSTMHRACMRLDAALRLLSSWMSDSRRLRWCRAAEVKWQQVAGLLLREYPGLKPELTRLLEAGRIRQALTDGLLSRIRHESGSLDERFVALKDGIFGNSFGF